MPASTRPASFEWAFGTVLQKNNNWAEAEPGESGSPHDKFRCNFCSKDFQCLLPRGRAHVAGVKGFDVKACTGPSKRDDETIRSFETRVEQFKHARDRCKTAIEEKQSEASKKKRALLMDAATGVSTRTASKVARQAGIQMFLPEGKSKQQEANEALTRGFYSAGIAPNVLDNPLFIEGLRRVALVGPSYDPPERRALVGDMLQKDHRMGCGLQSAHSSARN